MCTVQTNTEPGFVQSFDKLTESLLSFKQD